MDERPFYLLRKAKWLEHRGKLVNPMFGVTLGLTKLPVFAPGRETEPQFRLQSRVVNQLNKARGKEGLESHTTQRAKGDLRSEMLSRGARKPGSLAPTHPAVVLGWSFPLH